MATQTSFLGLTNQAGTEKNHRPVINGNNDIVDAFASGISEALAIVVNGNTAPKAIAAGQYLFIKNHSTLATGGYHAKSAISSGATISSSNVEADADGIANSLYAKIMNNWNVAGTITENNASVTIPNNTKRISLRYEKDYIKCEGIFNINTNGSAYLGFLHNNLTTIVVFQAGTAISYNAVRDKDGNNLSSYSIEVRTSIV